MRSKLEKRKKRILHVRKSIGFNNLKPRISVFRSNKHIYAQLIDDVNSKTLVSSSDLEIKNDGLKPIEVANKVGKLLGERGVKLDIKNVVFDRRGYKYHGRVKALADGARESGLLF